MAAIIMQMTWSLTLNSHMFMSSKMFSYPQMRQKLLTKFEVKLYDSQLFAWKIVRQLE